MTQEGQMCGRPTLTMHMTGSWVLDWCLGSVPRRFSVSQILTRFQFLLVDDLGVWDWNSSSIMATQTQFWSLQLIGQSWFCLVHNKSVWKPLKGPFPSWGLPGVVLCYVFLYSVGTEFPRNWDTCSQSIICWWQRMVSYPLSLPPPYPWFMCVHLMPVI